MPNYFVPSIITPIDPYLPNRKGACLPMDHVHRADVGLVGAYWFYDWACTNGFVNDPSYVPMSWDGGWMLPLPPTYTGPLLVLNEPDNDGQLNIHPAIAAARILELANHYPQAQLIIGGFSYYGEKSLREFVQHLGTYRPAGWHVHGYAEWNITTAQVMAWFSNARNICPGGQFWVTEFASVGDDDLSDELMHAVRNASWIDRYAWFTTRIGVADWYLPKHWRNPALVDANGQLTRLGEMYRSL
jgi:hypothetical protein